MPSTNSLSLLNELKDIAEVAAERERSAPSSMKATPTPQPSSGRTSSSFSLSDALADVKGLVDEEARAEQTLRTKTQELAQAALQAEREAEKSRERAEMAARVAAEESRRQQLAEERRIAQLRADYEAAIARGEQVELPPELRPPEPEPELKVFEQAKERVAAPVLPPPKSQAPMIMGGVAALVAAAVGLYFVFAEPPPEPVKEDPAAMISFQQSQAELEERKRIAEEARLKREEEAKASIAAAKKKAEEDEEKKKAKARAKRRLGQKGKGKGKGKGKDKGFSVGLDGF